MVKKYTGVKTLKLTIYDEIDCTSEVTSILNIIFDINLPVFGALSANK